MRLFSPLRERPASRTGLPGPQAAFLLLVFAGLVAALAYRLPKPRADTVSYWDVSGALTLAGICAALFSEPDQVIPLIEHATRPQFAEQ